MDDVLIKPIKDYEGYYDITSDGRIYSKKRIVKQKTWWGIMDREYGDIWLSPIYDTDGYIKVTLNKNGKATQYKLHRLVAQHFIPNPDNKPYINHVNFERDDNRIENLQWVTPSENVLYTKNNGRTNVGEKHWNSKLTKQQVLEIRKNHNENADKNKTWEKYNISKWSYHDIINNITWCHL